MVLGHLVLASTNGVEIVLEWRRKQVKTTSKKGSLGKTADHYQQTIIGSNLQNHMCCLADHQQTIIGKNYMDIYGHKWAKITRFGVE